MAPPRRWIRLDVGWSDSDWVGALSPAGRLSWIELLTYAKRDGAAGMVKALTPAAFGRKVRIPAEDVAAMLEGAIDDGALEERDGMWIITNWPRFVCRGPSEGVLNRWKRIRLAVLRRDGGICRYCGEPATHCDHVLPRVRGGSDDPENLVAACGWCNRSKGSRTPDEWRSIS